MSGFEMKSNYSIILLAAGSSSRMGKPKQLLSIHEETLIEHTLKKAIALKPHSIITVLGANVEKIQAVLDETKTHIVYNKNWKQGMGTSVAVGIQALQHIHPDAQAVLILVGDQPYLSTLILEKIIILFEQSDKTIVSAHYGKTFGVPVLFDKKWWSNLMELTGDKGAKKLMMNHANEMAFVDFPKGIFDLDTPEDYERWLTYYFSKK